MKTLIHLMTCAVVAAMSMEAAKAALNIPSDGSDGALVITNNTVIDLSQAVTGNWDANNSANAGKGIYDSNKWAVVFKYSSVTIQGGATVTFANHGSRAPVVWLVQSNVTINGTLSLDGQQSLSPPWLSEPGPGGFRGGSGFYAIGAEEAAGFGPGGGGADVGNNYGHFGGAGSYGTAGSYNCCAYGNPSLIPLIGGSGGGGRAGSGPSQALSGGAGGGAILIASGGSLSIASTGTIRADGGSGYRNVPGFAPSQIDCPAGSGGGIRLVAETFAGNGLVQCLGGGGYYTGGAGRIRIERAANSFNGTIAPTGPSVVELTSGATPLIWVPANGPSVKIVSIGGRPSTADPRAGFGSIGADTVLPRVSNVTVVVETTNVETNTTATTITVRATPRSNGSFTQAAAALTQVINQDPLVARWTANVPVQDGYSAIQVKVVRP